ncbi:hypothetical protein DPMN_060694 [Dreissena polymorpha]|uniref:Uncharacterized protein n=1 Tax=Dreissena polymorpha TaxID=45954 RepID=A0A9D4C6G2_DREPO|nr:hypothetical protein DPMN_060694 [Dreissena polymorpha]
MNVHVNFMEELREKSRVHDTSSGLLTLSIPSELLHFATDLTEKSFKELIENSFYKNDVRIVAARAP